MARVLIVGCGCRGRALAVALLTQGHAVRGTTREPATIPAIEGAGAEGVLADPDRLATVLQALAGVAVVCWLMGSARHSPELHGDRLRTLMERLVDTPVRGLVYEAAGPAGAEPLGRGETIVREASATWRIPVELLDVEPADHEAWVSAASDAVTRLLAARAPG